MEATVWQQSYIDCYLRALRVASCRCLSFPNRKPYALGIARGGIVLHALSSAALEAQPGPHRMPN